MSTVKYSGRTKKEGNPCKLIGHYGGFCRHHCPGDQCPPVANKTKKTTRTTKVSCSSSISAGNNQTLEEINVMLRAVVTKVGLNLEEVLLPVTKKYSPTHDDEDIKPEEEGEDEELLNWDKKTEEVKEITPEVLVEEPIVIKAKEEINFKETIVIKEIKTKEPILIEENKVEETIVVKEAQEEIKTADPIVIKENKVKEPIVIKENKVKEPIVIKENKVKETVVIEEAKEEKSQRAYC